ncbi:MAG TPA: cytidylate kinase-like family protein [Candidatus Cottocaccamicrobium excrementipullorum]|nr:cytidylate kinase-like family protein [Candidatus Cottocaccamicrobium excrementipullorum]
MKKILITIGRQYGSGGRAIGERLGELLQIPCYDRELIQMSSEKSGIEEGILALHDERTSSASMFKVKGQTGNHGTPIVDTLFLAQSQVIQELAEKGSCIFIGRCADYVLQDDEALFSVFISAPEKNRIARIMERNHMSADDAEMAVRKVDKQRRTYYDFYTDKSWGEAGSYMLAVDSSLFGIQGTAELLKEVICAYQKEEAALDGKNS